ncbi:MAG: class A beta-lactamase-related serine hydrolase [Bacteroidia bacterium]|nr:class A beta-lactamase-related serine hydrolase [Bacteroidia bacterium]
MSKRYLVLALVALVSFGLGFGLNELVRTKRSNHNAVGPVKVEKRQSGFKFINPILECQSLQNVEPPTIIKLKADLNALVDQVKKDGKATQISVYFRDLNNGPIIGIDQEAAYAPASLLKVPILIAVFKEDETNPGFLQKKFKYDHVTDPTMQANIVDSVSMKLGNSYSMLDLVERMIIHSDNEAKGLIVENIPEANLVQVHKELGIVVPGVRGVSDFMTVRDYSTFFRILYNGTYLTHEHSELALEILSKTTFNKGIKAGIDDPLALVAHKFGERGLPEINQMQLHDCGIVYCNGHTYLLSVMTKGKDFDQLAKVIAQISKLVFDRVGR